MSVFIPTMMWKVHQIALCCYFYLELSLSGLSYELTSSAGWLLSAVSLWLTQDSLRHSHTYLVNGIPQRGNAAIREHRNAHVEIS